MKVFDEVGRGTTSAFAYAGGVAELLGDSVRYIVALRIRVRETVDQAYLLGVQSWAIVLLTSLFTGMVISLESAAQAASFGVSNLVGGAVAFASARELERLYQLQYNLTAERGVVAKRVEAVRGVLDALAELRGG